MNEGESERIIEALEKVLCERGFDIFGTFNVHFPKFFKH